MPLQRAKISKQGLTKQADLALLCVYYNLGGEAALSNTPSLLFNVVNRTRSKRPISLKQIKHWLTGQDAATKHKRLWKRAFPRRKLTVFAPATRVDIDLVDLGATYPQWNDGYRYILTAIDAFTRRMWAAPLRVKDATSVARRLRHMIEKEGLHTIHIYSDAGKEFLGAPVQKLFQQKGFSHRLCTANEFHCPFVERLNRTLKEKLFQAMTVQQSNRWLNLLPKAVSSYNQTPHSSTGMRPLDVADADTLRVYAHIHALSRKTANQKKPKYKFKAGDKVRLLKAQGPFTRGFRPRFTNEVFEIAGPAEGGPYLTPPAYLIRDLEDGQVIQHAIFYKPELSKGTDRSKSI